EDDGLEGGPQVVVELVLSAETAQFELTAEDGPDRALGGDGLVGDTGGGIDDGGLAVLLEEAVGDVAEVGVDGAGVVPDAEVEDAAADVLAEIVGCCRLH